MSTTPQQLAKEFCSDLARTERRYVYADVCALRCALLEAQARALEEAATDFELRGKNWLSELAQMKRDQMDLEVSARRQQKENSNRNIDEALLQELWEAATKARARGTTEKQAAALFLGVAAAKAKIMGKSRDAFLQAAAMVFDATKAQSRGSV